LANQEGLGGMVFSKASLI